MAKAGGKRNGYKMPAPIANGEIIEDLNKKQWKIGPSIGKGGFGEIYSVLEIGTSKKNDYVYVAKIVSTNRFGVRLERYGPFVNYAIFGGFLTFFNLKIVYVSR